MIYEEVSDRTEQNRRVKTFRNKETGNETKIYPIYKDNEGRDWWGFLDLNRIPYMRYAMARHIIDLFNLGISKKDLMDWNTQQKVLLKSDDVEKYEKLYSNHLELERLINFTADPIKQHLALATVYILNPDEERVDFFESADSEKKMKLWQTDRKAITFFLEWHNKHILAYYDGLLKISQTVSKLEKR